MVFLQPLADKQPTSIGTLIASPSGDPSRSRTGCALYPVLKAKGADRGSEAPSVIDPLDASLVAHLDVESALAAALAIRQRFLPLVHTVDYRTS